MPSLSLPSAKVNPLRWLTELNLRQLNKDALARAHLGGFNDGALQTRAHHGKAAGASRIIQNLAGLNDVRNAVIEQREHIRCMIDA